MPPCHFHFSSAGQKSVRRQLLVGGPQRERNGYWGSEKHRRIRTFDVEVHSDESGRVGGNLALVSALVSFVDELDLKAPVVGILEFHRVARVTGVGVQSHRQQLQFLAGPPTHPRHLQHKHHTYYLSAFFSSKMPQQSLKYPIH